LSIDCLSPTPLSDESFAGERWIARELHDVVAQRLTTILVELQMLSRDHLSLAARARVESLDEEVRGGLQGVRELLRRLRGEPVTEEGFNQAMRRLLLEFQQKTSIETLLDVSSDWPDQLPAECALQLSRIVQEALTNVRLHSRATRVEVSLGLVEGCPSLIITDDGRSTVDFRETASAGMGILGMRERATILGAKLEIVSGQGRGTVVWLTLGSRPAGLVGAA
jgi:signal transduction histidine kinase